MLRVMSLGRSIKWIYDQHMKAVRDRWAEDEYVRDEGRAEGRTEALVKTVDILMNKYDTDFEEACREAGISVEEYHRYKNE